MLYAGSQQCTVFIEGLAHFRPSLDPLLKLQPLGGSEQHIPD